MRRSAIVGPGTVEVRRHTAARRPIATGNDLHTDVLHLWVPAAGESMSSSWSCPEDNLLCLVMSFVWSQPSDALKGTSMSIRPIVYLAISREWLMKRTMGRARAPSAGQISMKSHHVRLQTQVDSCFTGPCTRYAMIARRRHENRNCEVKGQNKLLSELCGQAAPWTRRSSSGCRRSAASSSELRSERISSRRTPALSIVLGKLDSRP